ncbi:hypothetical protein B0J11DRAFT_552234 [Dendryphion nanum]|uniref:NACHT domain-containing protein n=1 Tax=Dendryphion nanum TaxID=256645 RepID=A0A9P9DHA0_9PLEO|nr:hypothetical protein B0J11DRAFT_552234 [Dendryphion nanum]
MSKVLANTFRLKPEIRLAQAVSQFEACLSDEQKRNFRAHQSQLLNISPTHGDVMRLTAEIDRRMSRDTKSRCVGPRFTSFLEGVQQFAALGDVVVGGSQNIVACGVWSLVRMSLLSIINISSYVEKLSVLFMDIGRSAPRYQTMAILYPQSKQLQSQLLEYFTIVVNLCCHLLKFSQKSTFLQLTHSLTDSDLKIFKTELTRWSDSIKEEMILAEAVENSQFKSLSTKFSNAASHHQKIITNLRVLDFCSKYDHETAWKQIRKIGNSTLYADLAEYINWKDSSKSSTFLCAGKLGSGKSVLLANIVDDLNIHASSDKTTVAYFFCKYDVPESLRARTILGSIARQLLRTMPDLTMVAQDCMESHATNDTEKVLDILLRGFPFANRLYFVIDGLDECSALERETFVGILGKLQKRATLMLCLSFRVEPNKNLGLVFKSLAVPHICPIPEDNPDIQTFIEVELERCLQSRNLVIGDPTIILDIQDALSKGSQGMFLWVALQIQSLCEMRTDQAIKDALLDLPNDLPGTFARILLKSGKSGRTYQSKILRLVVAARRPLTTGELGEALSVIPGDATWTSSNLVNDVHLALGYCGCVITVDEEESTVHFVHHSVKQFILGEFHNSDGITFRTEQAERTMADIIVTYLSYGVFGTEVTEMRILPVSVQSAPATVMRSTLGSSGIQPDFDISKTLAGARRPFQSRSLHHFCFFAYAEAYWLDHILYVSGHMPNIYNLSLKLIQQRANDGILNAKDDWEYFDGRTSLSFAAQFGHELIVEMLLNTILVEIDSKDKDGRTPLSYAVQNGRILIVDFLLDTNQVDINSKDKNGKTPLSWATEYGNQSIINLCTTFKWSDQ